LKKIDIDWGDEWHIPIYADGDVPDFLKEISAELTEGHGITVTDPIYVIYADYTVMRVSSDTEGKIKAVCTSLKEKGARFGKDCDGLSYAVFTNSEFGDLF
jgi:hypothetical protein